MTAADGLDRSLIISGRRVETPHMPASLNPAPLGPPAEASLVSDGD